MAFAYTIKDEEGIYFVTFTITQWIDVFTRPIYIDIFLDSIRYCQKEKGLLVYAYVIMTNHVHLIIRSNKEPLSDIIRDIKKFTASKIVKAIEENPKESRKKWLLWLLKKDGKISFWQAGYHGEEILTDRFMQGKIEYIHNNPVRAGIVADGSFFENSSCAAITKGRQSKLALYGY